MQAEKKGNTCARHGGDFTEVRRNHHFITKPRYTILNNEKRAPRGMFPRGAMQNKGMEKDAGSSAALPRETVKGVC